MSHTSAYQATVPRRGSKWAARSKWADPELTDGCQLEHDPATNPQCEMGPAQDFPVQPVPLDADPAPAPASVEADSGVTSGVRTHTQPTPAGRVAGQDYKGEAMTVRDLVALAADLSREVDLDSKIKAWVNVDGFVHRVAAVEPIKVTVEERPATEAPAPPVAPTEEEPVKLRGRNAGAAPISVGAMNVTPAPVNPVLGQLAGAFGRGRGRVPR